MLSILLNGNEGIFSPGEMGPAPAFATPDYVCSCGELLTACPFYCGVARRLERRQVDFCPYDWGVRYDLPVGYLVARVLQGSWQGSRIAVTRDKLLSKLKPYRRWKASRDARLIHIARACLEEAGARVFVDATKTPRRISEVAAVSELELRVLHLVRDPRGYVASAKRRLGVSVRVATTVWCRVNRDVLRRAASCGVPYLLVPYEALCARVEGVLRGIDEFLAAGGQNTAATEPLEHHVIGNEARLREWRYTDVKLDERWRTELTDSEQREVIERVVSFGDEVQDLLATITEDKG